MVFIQKKRLSNFCRWLKMESSQNWPDLRSPISKFRNLCFIDTVTHVNAWKFRGDWSVSYDEHSNFSEVRSVDVTWVLTLSSLNLKFSQCVRKWCVSRCAKTAVLCVDVFTGQTGNPSGGSKQPQSGRELNVYREAKEVQREVAIVHMKVCISLNG